MITKIPRAAQRSSHSCAARSVLGRNQVLLNQELRIVDASSVGGVDRQEVGNGVLVASHERGVECGVTIRAKR